MDRIDTDKEAVILKRLYLDKGMKGNTVEIYIEHIRKMRNLDTLQLKLLYVIYNEILPKIESRLNPKVLEEYKIKELNKEKILMENEKLLKYVNSRLPETDLKKYLNDSWHENLVLIEDELDTFFINELMDIYIKCIVMKNLVETFITVKDEYWKPSTLNIVINIEALGYSIEEKKERIWQPKNS